MGPGPAPPTFLSTSPRLSFIPAVDAIVSATIMAPQLDAVQHILIETMLTKGFKNNLIASGALFTPRTVQRIRRERQQSEKSTRTTARVGRRSRMTPDMRI